eukprot:scaffold94322_cov51-Phaeocystis_antarctica.AAC.2
MARRHGTRPGAGGVRRGERVTLGGGASRDDGWIRLKGGCEYAGRVGVRSTSQGPVRVRGQRHLVRVRDSIRGGIALEEEILDRVRLGPGFSVTFSPNGETQTSFCPGVCVSGMTHSIVSSFSPGTAGAGSSAGADAGTGVTILSGNISVWPGWAVSGTFSATCMPTRRSIFAVPSSAGSCWGDNQFSLSLTPIA